MIMKGLLPAPLVKHLFATQEKAVQQSSRQFLNTISPGGGSSLIKTIGAVEIPSYRVFGKSGMSPNTVQVTTSGTFGPRKSFVIRHNGPHSSEQAVIVGQVPVAQSVMSKKDVVPVTGRDREAVTQEFLREMGYKP
jgi:hypothetical protein